MCPEFTGSDSRILTSYQKVLWICSLEYENMLNCTWCTKKFHNHNNTNQSYICILYIFIGEWPYYDEDGFMDEDDMPEPDSDDEYEDSFSKKRGGGGRGGRKSGGPGSRGVCF